MHHGRIHPPCFKLFSSPPPRVARTAEPVEPWHEETGRQKEYFLILFIYPHTASQRGLSYSQQKGVRPKVIPLKSFLDHSRLQNSQKGLWRIIILLRRGWTWHIPFTPRAWTGISVVSPASRFAPCVAGGIVGAQDKVLALEPLKASSEAARRMGRRTLKLPAFSRSFAMKQMPG